MSYIKIKKLPFKFAPVFLLNSKGKRLGELLGGRLGFKVYPKIDFKIEPKELVINSIYDINSSIPHPELSESYNLIKKAEEETGESGLIRNAFGTYKYYYPNAVTFSKVAVFELNTDTQKAEQGSAEEPIEQSAFTTIEQFDFILKNFLVGLLSVSDIDFICLHMTGAIESKDFSLDFPCPVLLEGGMFEGCTIKLENHNAIFSNCILKNTKSMAEDNDENLYGQITSAFYLIKGKNALYTSFLGGRLCEIPVNTEIMENSTFYNQCFGEYKNKKITYDKQFYSHFSPFIPIQSRERTFSKSLLNLSNWKNYTISGSLKKKIKLKNTYQKNSSYFHNIQDLDGNVLTYRYTLSTKDVFWHNERSSSFTSIHRYKLPGQIQDICNDSSLSGDLLPLIISQTQCNVENDTPETPLDFIYAIWSGSCFKNIYFVGVARNCTIEATDTPRRSIYPLADYYNCSINMNHAAVQLRFLYNCSFHGASMYNSIANIYVNCNDVIVEGIALSGNSTFINSNIKYTDLRVSGFDSTIYDKFIYSPNSNSGISAYYNSTYKKQYLLKEDSLYPNNGWGDDELPDYIYKTDITITAPYLNSFPDNKYISVLPTGEF